MNRDLPPDRKAEQFEIVGRWGAVVATRGRGSRTVGRIPRRRGALEGKPSSVHGYEIVNGGGEACLINERAISPA